MRCYNLQYANCKLSYRILFIFSRILFFATRISFLPPPEHLLKAILIKAIRV